MFCPHSLGISMASGPIVHDVFTAREIARAAGASIADVHALRESGVIVGREGGLTATSEAIRAVLLLRGLQPGRPRNDSSSARRHRLEVARAFL